MASCPSCGVRLVLPAGGISLMAVEVAAEGGNAMILERKYDIFRKDQEIFEMIDQCKIEIEISLE